MTATTRNGSVPSRLLDLLQTYAGEWMTVDQVTTLYVEAFGLVAADTLRRSVTRLCDHAADYDLEIRPRRLDDEGRIEIRIPWRVYWETDLPPAS